MRPDEIPGRSSILMVLILGLALASRPAVAGTPLFDSGYQDGKAFGERMGRQAGTKAGRELGLEDGFRKGYEQAQREDRGGPPPAEPPPSDEPPADPPPTDPPPADDPPPGDDPPPADPPPGDDPPSEPPPGDDPPAEPPPGDDPPAEPPPADPPTPPADDPPQDPPPGDGDATGVGPVQTNPLDEPDAPGTTGPGTVTSITHAGILQDPDRLMATAPAESDLERALEEFPDLSPAARNMRRLRRGLAPSETGDLAPATAGAEEPEAPPGESTADEVHPGIEDGGETTDAVEDGSGPAGESPDPDPAPAPGTSDATAGIIDNDYTRGFALGYAKGYALAYVAAKDEAYQGALAEGVERGKAEYERLHRRPDGGRYTPADQLELAKKAILAGRYEDAIHRIDVILEALGGTELLPEAIYYKAAALYMNRQPAQAISTARKMIAQYPASGFADDSLFVVGTALETQKTGGFLGLFTRGRWQEALEAYRELVVRYPTSTILPEAWFRIGLNSERIRKREDAVAAYQKIVSEYPDSAAAVRARERLARME